MLYSFITVATFVNLVHGRHPLSIYSKFKVVAMNNAI